MVKGAIKAAQKMISPSEEILWAQMGQIYTKPTSDELITDFKELNSNNLTGVIDVEQLQSLKQLYDAGVITAEEFAAKKAQILNL